MPRAVAACTERSACGERSERKVGGIRSGNRAEPGPTFPSVIDRNTRQRPVFRQKEFPMSEACRANHQHSGGAHIGATEPARRPPKGGAMSRTLAARIAGAVLATGAAGAIALAGAGAANAQSYSSTPLAPGQGVCSTSQYASYQVRADGS